MIDASSECYVAVVPPREEFLELRGLRHRLLRWGPPSAEPIVLLHGFQDCADTFQFLVDALPRDWSFIGLDWRGFGGSEPTGEPYWFPDYLADLEALLDVLDTGAPRAWRLVGHSMGGNIASLSAGIRPARVSQLVSLEGFGLPRSQPGDASCASPRAARTTPPSTISPSCSRVATRSCRARTRRSSPVPGRAMRARRCGCTSTPCTGS